MQTIARISMIGQAHLANNQTICLCARSLPSCRCPGPLALCLIRARSALRVSASANFSVMLTVNSNHQGPGRLSADVQFVVNRWPPYLLCRVCTRSSLSLFTVCAVRCVRVCASVCECSVFVFYNSAAQTLQMEIQQSHRMHVD